MFSRVMVCVAVFLISVASLAWGETISPPCAKDKCFVDSIPETTPSRDFTIIGEGDVVHHKKTGLEWQRCPLGQDWDGSECIGRYERYTWQDALEKAYEYKDDGWRLPNIKELSSISEECRTDPAINQNVFPGLPSWSDPFWSSTPYERRYDEVWVVNFRFGTQSAQEMSDRYRVRLVRGGQ